MEDYYKVLGVAKDATNDEIKKAYRKLALEHHPDRGGDDKKFKKINEAYQILSDPQKRAQYDQFGSAGVGGAGFGGGGSTGWDFTGGQGFDFSGFGFGGGGLGDIFGDFFSSAFATVQAEVEITPAQAVLGESIDLQVGEEQITLEIPRGTQDGAQFRFKGKGRQANNGKRGDLIIQVRVRMPERLSEEQKKLWEELKELDRKKKNWWQR